MIVVENIFEMEENWIIAEKKTQTYENTKLKN